MISMLKNLLKFRNVHPNDYARKAGVKMGKNCQLGTLSFGSEPYLISMGNNVSTSDLVQFITHDGSMRVIRNIYPEFKDADLFGKITIGNNVFIGIGATILPGTYIGDNTIIGAASLVKGQIKSNSVYAGIPAKYICSIEEYVEKNRKYFHTTKQLDRDDKKAYLVKHYNSL